MNAKNPRFGVDFFIIRNNRRNYLYVMALAPEYTARENNRTILYL